ncbi:MAG: TonB-dependent receptor, partial [Candidatus Poribacteria bacterium]|nr:TonB-dependent receptor [Candidatus Poribacteria bacterium]
TNPSGAVEFSQSLPPHAQVTSLFANEMAGETYGVELSSKWRPLDWLQLHPVYTFLQMQLRNSNAGDEDPAVNLAEGQNPRHQLSIQSSVDLPGHFEFDLWGRYVDELPNIKVDSYLTFDARLGWRPVENIDVSIVGKNLLEKDHLEFISEFLNIEQTFVKRSVYGRITWGF